MVRNYYLAVDIGASSGRHMLAHIDEGKMVLEEIHRFSNAAVEKNGHMVWDVDRLFGEILKGMKKCASLGKNPVSMGVDTWGVDYVLLDKDNKRPGDTFSYRDKRTAGVDKKVYEYICEEELYKRTGIQKQIFNTIYQLMALKEQNHDILGQADSMLMIPDYFHFLLTGKKLQEYTNATTTQLVSPVTKDWDMELIKTLGYPTGIFQKISLPGTYVGMLTEDIQKEVGFNCKVILPPTHDTASAVMAVPANEDSPLYISSGTWSLMGTELKEADCTKGSMLNNLTNEGGYNYRFRYLKNIMGLWMIQSVKKETAPDLSFGELCEYASKENISSIVDVNEERFLAPESMADAVKKACEETGQEVPHTPPQLAAVIYNSLAKCYGDTAGEIEELTGRHYDSIHIIGGGSNAEYLNRLTAKATNKRVLAGPGEATAIGNIATMMIAMGELKDLKDARKCIYNSFPIEIFE